MNFILRFLAVCLLVSLTACGRPRETADWNPPRILEADPVTHELHDTGRVVSAIDVLAPINESPVVRLRYERTEAGQIITGHGTAFFIRAGDASDRVRLLTAAHNILDERGNPYATVAVEFAKDDWRPMRVEHFEEKYDIALLAPTKPFHAYFLHMRLGAVDAGVSDKVCLNGSKRGTPVCEYAGVVAELHDGGTVRDRMRIEFDHGDSGGPVTNAAGDVVGIAVAGVPKDGDLDHNVGLFIPVSIIKKFLEGAK